MPLQNLERSPFSHSSSIRRKYPWTNLISSYSLISRRTSLGSSTVTNNKRRWRFLISFQVHQMLQSKHYLAMLPFPAISFLNINRAWLQKITSFISISYEITACGRHSFSRVRLKLWFDDAKYFRRSIYAKHKVRKVNFGEEWYHTV